jgi:hypothetical protein
MQEIEVKPVLSSYVTLDQPSEYQCLFINRTPLYTSESAESRPGTGKQLIRL